MAKKTKQSTSAELLGENERLRSEIADLKETAAVQGSLFEIAELHSTIYIAIHEIKDTISHGAYRENA
jgi:hypothetical protein